MLALREFSMKIGSNLFVCINALSQFPQHKNCFLSNWKKFILSQILMSSKNLDKVLTLKSSLLFSNKLYSKYHTRQRE